MKQTFDVHMYIQFVAYLWYPLRKSTVEANASVGGMALGATLRAPTALPGRETISAKAFRLPATLPGLSLGWRCSYDAPACLVLFWWMMRDEPVSTRVGGFAIHEGWPMLQIDNLSYRILRDKLPSQKQHAYVEMYTYPHYKSNKKCWDHSLSINFTLRYSSKSLAQDWNLHEAQPRHLSVKLIKTRRHGKILWAALNCSII